MGRFCFSYLLFSSSITFFFLFPACVADDGDGGDSKGGSNSGNPDFSLGDHCSDLSPDGTPPWWLPLQKSDPLSRDPCQIHDTMKHSSDGIVTTCCFGNDIGGTGAENCGPCTSEMYNLAAACMACSNDGFSPSSIPVINNASIFKQGDGKHQIELTFPNVTAFNQGNRSINAETLQSAFQLPRWLNAPLLDTLFFDPNAAIQVALQAGASSSQVLQPPPGPAQSPNSPTASPSNVSPSPPPYPGPNDTTTPTSSTTTVSPESTRDSSPPTNASALAKKSSSRAATIAAAIIGAFLGVALVSLAIILYVRRRRRAQLAPSARFVTVTGPGAGMGYTMSRDEEAPPPFSPGGWKMPILEKAETIEDVKRHVNAGVYRDPSF